MIENFKNKLIVFEGVDHSGKSTLAKALYDRLTKSGIDTILTKQPGDAPGELGVLTRSLCIDKKWGLNPVSNLFSFLLDRSEHISKVIIPALTNGKTVVCDRWGYSTIAYQFYGKELIRKYNLSDDFASTLNSFASFNLDPDVVFFIERDINNIKKEKNDDFDQFETESDLFKDRVNKAYYKLLEENNDLFVDIKVLENDIEGTLNLILDSEF